MVSADARLTDVIAALGGQHKSLGDSRGSHVVTVRGETRECTANECWQWLRDRGLLSEVQS